MRTRLLDNLILPKDYERALRLTNHDTHYTDDEIV
jgi:hypothetical protein